MNELTLGPYRVGDQPWAVVYDSFDRATGKRRNLTGYEAAVVLRKPNGREAQHPASITAPVLGEITFPWPEDPFDLAGNWDLDFWVANSQRKFCSDTFGFRVAPSLLVPTITFSQQDP